MSEINIVCFNPLEHTTNMTSSRTWCIAVSVIVKLLKFLGESDCVLVYIYIYIYIYISGGPLSALTCCVNARLLSAIKKNIAVNLFSKLGWELGLYYASYDDFHPDILARMYT